MGRVMGIHTTVDPATRQPLPADKWQYKVHLDHEESPGFFPRSQIMVESNEVERTVATMATEVQSRNQTLRDRLQESYSVKQAEMRNLLDDLRRTARYIGASRYCRRMIMDSYANA